MSSKREAKRHSRPSAADKPAPRTTQTIPAKPTGWRLWVFRAIALLVVPAVFFGAVEVGLRLFGYGHPAGPFIKVKLDGQTCYGDNTEYSQRFFPRHLAREAMPYLFPADKPESTCRIFVLGASAAMGVPEPAFSFARMLRLMLVQQYPGVDFEVINTGMAAINSHAVLPIAREAAKHDPDVFLVYLGNNEVTGPYGAGTVFAPLSGNLSVIRAAIAFKGTRLGQLLTNTLASIGAGASAPQMWRGLEMFLDKQVRADDPGLQDVYQHFEANLNDIVAAGHKGGAKVVLCTVAANLKDCPPFGSLHRADLTEDQKHRWEEIYQQGVEHEQAGRWAQAVERYLAAGQIDDSYADLQFRLGRCYWAMNEFDQAADRYVKARRFDTLRFRADERINDIIRAMAGDTGQAVTLFDTDEMLGRHSDHNVPGAKLFYEHVHMNFTGSYWVARLLFDHMVNQDVLPERIARMQSSTPTPLTEAECARRLAFTELDRYQVAEKVLSGFIRRPPFSNQLYHDEQVTRMEQDVAAMKAGLTAEAMKEVGEQHRWAVENDQSDWLLHFKFGQFLSEHARDYRAATEQFRWVQSRLPHSWLGHNGFGMMRYALGDLDAAIAAFRTTIRLKPTSGATHFYLAEALQKKGRTDEAIRHYREAIQWERDCIPAYNNLARIYSERGKLDQAVAVCRRGVVFCPDSATLHGTLGTLLARQGHRDEALRELRTALQLDPNSAAIRSSLQVLLGGRG
ncbi:MAG: tetratricopeptide repeat protein [Sedimentisphaerales bacterium]|nr:tetratricopeptide repeat protein [Sedimentisphaerales bacterium]